MSRFSVCYTSTPGYLFSTMVSAVQARAHVGDDVAIYIAMFNDGDTSEQDAFARVAGEHDIRILDIPRARLNGLHPTFARLLLDQFLPDEVEEILYLDGDTQVVGDIDPLVRAEVPDRGAIGARDPMVFIRRSSASFQEKIDGWWDSSHLPQHVRDSYINAGMLRISRSYLPELREATIGRYGDRIADFKFLDQDVINLALDGRIDVVSMGWNYPGFLLGTQMVDQAPPRIIHFMSNPRPWNAPLPPWGRRFYEPYEAFVTEYPETEPYWPRFSLRRRLRYELQQRVKAVSERPRWQSTDAATAVRDLDRSNRPLG